MVDVEREKEVGRAWKAATSLSEVAALVDLWIAGTNPITAHPYSRFPLTEEQKMVAGQARLLTHFTMIPFYFQGGVSTPLRRTRAALHMVTDARTGHFVQKFLQDVLAGERVSVTCFPSYMVGRKAQRVVIEATRAHTSDEWAPGLGLEKRWPIKYEVPWLFHNDSTELTGRLYHALNISYSFTLIDMQWGRESFLFEQVIDAGLAWAGTRL